MEYSDSEMSSCSLFSNGSSRGGPDVIPQTPPRSEHTTNCFQSRAEERRSDNSMHQSINCTPTSRPSALLHQSRGDPFHLPSSRVVTRVEGAQSEPRQSSLLNPMKEVLCELKQMNSKLSEVTERLGVVEGRLHGLEENSVSISSDASEKKKNKISPEVRVRYHVQVMLPVYLKSIHVTLAFGP